MEHALQRGEGVERTVTLEKGKGLAVECGRAVVICPCWLFLRAHTVR